MAADLVETARAASASILDRWHDEHPLATTVLWSLFVAMVEDPWKNPTIPALHLALLVGHDDEGNNRLSTMPHLRLTAITSPFATGEWLAQKALDTIESQAARRRIKL